jgi:hypothetical protein
VLLAEICALKDRDLTTEDIVIDFIFKNIQPLKDRVYPAYLYTRVNDPTRITIKRISEEDVLGRVDVMLRGKVSNASAPFSYYAWNLPPQSPFFQSLYRTVTEPPKSLGPSTVVLVHRTSDNPVDAPDHLTSSVSVFFTFPKSVSPVSQILQHIGGTNKRKQLQ